MVIVMLQLFKGTFFHCEGPNVKHVRDKTECLADKKNTWVNQKYNFDDLGKALMSLFVLSSRDGWVNIMYTGLDAVGVDQQVWIKTLPPLLLLRPTSVACERLGTRIAQTTRVQQCKSIVFVAKFKRSV